MLREGTWIITGRSIVCRGTLATIRHASTGETNEAPARKCAPGTLTNRTFVPRITQRSTPNSQDIPHVAQIEMHPGLGQFTSRSSSPGSGSNRCACTALLTWSSWRTYTWVIDKAALAKTCESPSKQGSKNDAKPSMSRQQTFKAWARCPASRISKGPSGIQESFRSLDANHDLLSRRLCHTRPKRHASRLTFARNLAHRWDGRHINWMTLRQGDSGRAPS